MSVLSWEHDESPVSIVDFVLGQHELDDAVVHRAIGRRLVEAGLSEPVDKVVRDARTGEPWAMDLIQTVELPAPTERLSMPVQTFGTGRTRRWIDVLRARFAPRHSRTA